MAEKFDEFYQNKLNEITKEIDLKELELGDLKFDHDGDDGEDGDKKKAAKDKETSLLSSFPWKGSTDFEEIDFFKCIF